MVHTVFTAKSDPIVLLQKMVLFKKRSWNGQVIIQIETIFEAFLKFILFNFNQVKSAKLSLKALTPTCIMTS